MLTPTQLSNLATIAAASVSCEFTTGTPADLLCAQCILESAWLKAAPGNNCFGIKDWAGNPYGRQLIPSREWFNDHELAWFLHLNDRRTAIPVENTAPTPSGRLLYRTMDWFATFPDLKSCFNKRAALFLYGSYRTFQVTYTTDHNFENYVRGISKFYSTTPNYADVVLSIVRQPDVVEAITVARMNVGQPKALPV